MSRRHLQIAALIFVGVLTGFVAPATAQEKTSELEGFFREFKKAGADYVALARGVDNQRQRSYQAMGMIGEYIARHDGWKPRLAAYYPVLSNRLDQLATDGMRPALVIALDQRDLLRNLLFVLGPDLVADGGQSQQVAKWLTEKATQQLAQTGVTAAELATIRQFVELSQHLIYEMDVAGRWFLRHYNQHDSKSGAVQSYLQDAAALLRQLFVSLYAADLAFHQRTSQGISLLQPLLYRCGKPAMVELLASLAFDESLPELTRAAAFATAQFLDDGMHLPAAHLLPPADAERARQGLATFIATRPLIPQRAGAVPASVRTPPAITRMARGVDQNSLREAFEKYNRTALHLREQLPGHRDLAMPPLKMRGILDMLH